jgi:hypothetical protein
MLIPKVLDNKSKALIAVAFAGLLTVAGCSIDVKDGKNGEASKVDIQTPVGGIHVNEAADIRDTGLPAYPGARIKEKSHDGESKSANVNLSSMGFGLKVVALEYESDDPPDKVMAFYRDKLKKYGDVLQCRTTKHGGDVDADYHGSESSSKPVTCKGDNSGSVIELKVGTENNQHIVSVEPEGKGTDFAVVLVQIHGKDTI